VQLPLAFVLSAFLRNVRLGDGQKFDEFNNVWRGEVHPPVRAAA
jgi:hypothetical protein